MESKIHYRAAAVTVLLSPSERVGRIWLVPWTAAKTVLVSASERASLLVARVAAKTVLMSGCSYDGVDERRREGEWPVARLHL